MHRELISKQLQRICEALEEQYRSPDVSPDLLEEELLSCLIVAESHDVLGFVEERVREFTPEMLRTLLLLFRFIPTDHDRLRAAIMILARIFELIDWRGASQLGMDKERNRLPGVEDAETDANEYLMSLNTCCCDALIKGASLTSQSTPFQILANLVVIQAWISFTGAKVPCDLRPLDRAIQQQLAANHPLWLKSCVEETLGWIANFYKWSSEPFKP